MIAAETDVVVDSSAGPATVAMEVSHLHGFLAAIFRREISVEQLEQLRSAATVAILLDAGIDLEQAFGDGAPEDLIQDLAVEYAALFLGPGEHISPHESVQLEPVNGVLWGDATVAVRCFIEATGIEYAEDFRGIPDHVSVELEFLGELAKRESIAWRSGRTADAAGWLEYQQEFLRDHLSRWLFKFCKKVADGSEHPFYRDMARLTAAFVGSEIADVEQRLSVARSSIGMEPDAAVSA